MTPEQLVTQFWKAFDEARFEDVRHLLAEGFFAEWPQTGEVIRGADNLIQLNSNYPGRWRCHLREILSQGDRLAFLSPQLVRRILDGEQPVGVTVKTLTREHDLPLLWQEQETLVASFR